MNCKAPVGSDLAVTSLLCGVSAGGAMAPTRVDNTAVNGA
jgi:hypothetical protein